MKKLLHKQKIFRLVQPAGFKNRTADYSPVRGCMVVRPYGWALWENIRKRSTNALRNRSRQRRFPALHSPKFYDQRRRARRGTELAVVTHGGGQELEEPSWFARPLDHHGMMYAKWIQSYRDLPVLINQWANVVRWEMRTKLFLRTLEFYWQEGHTAHAAEQEAVEETERMLQVYADFARTEAAVPVIP